MVLQKRLLLLLTSLMTFVIFTNHSSINDTCPTIIPSIEVVQPESLEVNTIKANSTGFKPAVPNSSASIHHRKSTIKRID